MHVSNFSDFNEEKMRRYLNAELADTLGNLLNRCTSKAINPGQIWPSTECFREDTLSTAGKNLLQSLEELVGMLFETLHMFSTCFYIMVACKNISYFCAQRKLNRAMRP